MCEERSSAAKDVGFIISMCFVGGGNASRCLSAAFRVCAHTSSGLVGDSEHLAQEDGRRRVLLCHWCRGVGVRLRVMVELSLQVSLCVRPHSTSRTGISSDRAGWSAPE